MKKIVGLIIVCALAATCTGCSGTKAAEPEVARMKSICELATMDCYYHDVAMTLEEDVAGILLWKEDLNFWIEYETVVTLGIDATLVDIKVDGTTVTITLPEATILNKSVDSSTLNASSYYLAADSVDPTADQQIEALRASIANIEADVLADASLLLEARNRAQLLLEQYVESVGKAAGVEYTIEWVYLGAGEQQTGTDAALDVISTNETVDE